MASIDPDFHLNERQKNILAALAESTGKPWSVVLSEALDAYRGLAQPESANGVAPLSVADAMREAGLLGCLTDTPHDLSTNPAYMEGFGEHGE
jgi:hypothetical protein